VFDRLVSTVKVEARSFLTTLICALVAGVSGIIAILLFGIAIFIWTAGRYGSLEASLAMACFFLVAALIALAVMLYARSEAARRAAERAEQERREREEAAKNAPPAWMDPALLPKVLPVLIPIAAKAVQIGIKHRGLLVAAISSAVVGWGLLRERSAAADEEMPAAEQPAE
jgi:uncharacterized membrane protein